MNRKLTYQGKYFPFWSHCGMDYLEFGIHPVKMRDKTRLSFRVLSGPYSFIFIDIHLLRPNLMDKVKGL